MVPDGKDAQKTIELVKMIEWAVFRLIMLTKNKEIQIWTCRHTKLYITLDVP